MAGMCLTRSAVPGCPAAALVLVCGALARRCFGALLPPWRCSVARCAAASLSARPAAAMPGSLHAARDTRACTCAPSCGPLRCLFALGGEFAPHPLPLRPCLAPLQGGGRQPPGGVCGRRQLRASRRRGQVRSGGVRGRQWGWATSAPAAAHARCHAWQRAGARALQPKAPWRLPACRRSGCGQRSDQGRPFVFTEASPPFH